MLRVGVWLSVTFLILLEASCFKLKIIHFNDLHARFDEVTPKSAPCAASQEPCVGGVARLATTIQRLSNENPNHLVLNARDVFQGTVWYNLLKWNVSQSFMNMIKADAMTLGNHEFDDSLGGLVPFLTATKNVTPVLVSNLIFPEKQSDDLKQLRSLVKKDPLVLTVGDQSIGVIGVMYDETDKIGNTDPITFSSSIESVRTAAKQLKDKGVDKIIVLSHCGIFDDRKIAEQAGDDIDIIVGGHSHTLLYNGDPPSGHEVLDKYPMVIEAANKRKVLIVQALCHGLYVGNIDLTFNDEGEITSYQGQPVFQANSIEKNPVVNSRVQELRKEIEAKSSILVGKSEIVLSNDCREKECTFGNVLSDAYVWYFRDQPNAPKIAMIHPGDFRIQLAAGEITRGDLLSALPFASYAKKITIPGSTIRKAIEFGVTINRRCTFNALQTAGLKITVDYGKPVGQRTTIQVKKRGKKYEALNDSRKYGVLVNAYVLKGGDGFEMFQNATVEGWAPIDAELLEQYIKASGGIKSPARQEPRVTVTHPESAVDAVKKCKTAKRK